MSKPVNLVLGSGGARGLAHIGVIHELLAQDYQICSVTGCSMGALVDGGILNPLPVPPATIDSDIKTVAVSLAGSDVPNPFGKVIEEPVAEQPDNGGMHKHIEGFLENLSKKFGSEYEEKEDRMPSMTDVMLGMFSTMQDTLSRHRLASNPPDILIEIPSNICRTHEFYLANELIPAGSYWARRSLN